MRWPVIALAFFALLSSTAQTQNVLVPTRPVGDNSNAAASTAFVAQGQVITPPAGFNQAINITQTPSGTQAGGFNANTITITSTAALTGVSAFLDGVNMGCSLQTSAVQGGINCLQVITGLNAATNASNANRNYVGIVGASQANTGDGGTNTGAGALGAMTAANFIGSAVNGATNLFAVQGGEVNITLQTGSSARLKSGWAVVPLANDAVHGVSLDAGYVLGAQTGAVGLNQGYWLTNTHGQFPLASGATVLGSDSAGTVTHGVDLSPLTCSSDCFKSTGFLVDGSGNLTANNVTTAWTTFTPSPSCGTATFTVNSSRSKTVGKTTFLESDITITAIGTCTNQIQFSLPNTANSAAMMAAQDTAINGNMIGCRTASASSLATCVQHQIANYVVNQRLVIGGVYENQ